MVHVFLHCWITKDVPYAHLTRHLSFVVPLNKVKLEPSFDFNDKYFIEIGYFEKKLFLLPKGDSIVVQNDILVNYLAHVI